MELIRRFVRILPVALVSISACSSVAEVAAVDSVQYRCQLQRNGGCPTRVPGVPFYTKTTRCVQETTYITSLVTVTYKRAPSADTQTKVFLGPNPEMAERISKFVNDVEGNPPSAQLDDDWNKLVPAATPTGLLVANALNQEQQVDDSVTYFLNGVHPWAGTGSIKFDLAPDQTLTKVEASVTEETIKDLGNAIPQVAGALAGRPLVADVKAHAGAKQELRLLVLRRRDASCPPTTPSAISLDDFSTVESELRVPTQSSTAPVVKPAPKKDGE